jgi:hypothetical protein
MTKSDATTTTTVRKKLAPSLLLSPTSSPTLTSTPMLTSAKSTTSKLTTSAATSAATKTTIAMKQKEPLSNVEKLRQATRAPTMILRPKSLKEQRQNQEQLQNKQQQNQQLVKIMNSTLLESSFLNDTTISAMKINMNTNMNTNTSPKTWPRWNKKRKHNEKGNDNESMHHHDDGNSKNIGDRNNDVNVDANDDDDDDDLNLFGPQFLSNKGRHSTHLKKKTLKENIIVDLDMEDDNNDDDGDEELFHRNQSKIESGAAEAGSGATLTSMTRISPSLRPTTTPMLRKDEEKERSIMLTPRPSRKRTYSHPTSNGSFEYGAYSNSPTFISSTLISSRNNKNSNSVSNSRKRRKRPTGKFTKVLNSIRSSIESDWVRFQSGTYPYREPVDRRMDFNDPRNRADTIMDVTIIGGCPAPFNSSPNKVTILGYVHSFSLNGDKVQTVRLPKRTGGFRHSKITQSVSSSFGPHTIKDDETCTKIDDVKKEMLHLNVPTYAWFCFTHETMNEHGIGIGKALRLYNVMTLDTSSSIWRFPLIICTRLCEPCPKQLPPMITDSVPLN